MSAGDLDKITEDAKVLMLAARKLASSIGKLPRGVEADYMWHRADELRADAMTLQASVEGYVEAKR